MENVYCHIFTSPENRSDKLIKMTKMYHPVDTHKAQESEMWVYLVTLTDLSIIFKIIIYFSSPSWFEND